MAASARSVLVMFVGAGAWAWGAGDAMAQERVWSAGDGDWTQAGNWTPANVPDSFAESAIVPEGVAPRILLGSSLGVGRLVLDDPVASVVIAGAVGLTVHSLHLDGALIVSGDPSPGALGIGADAVLTGDGEIVLDPGVTRMSRARLSFPINRAVVIGAGLTVRGGGEIFGPFTCDGTILADADGATLIIGVGTARNRGQLRAANGGTLQLTGPEMINDGGEIRAEAGGRVVLVGGSVIGGPIIADAGGLVVIDGVVDFTGTTFHGDIDASRGVMLIENEGWFHDGIVTLGTGDDSRPAVAQVRFGGELTGGGTLRLNGHVPEFARLTSATLPLTLGPENTIEGVGQLDAPIIGRGRLSPGLPIGQIEVRLFGYAMMPEHTLVVDVSASASDRLVGDGPISAGGTLEVRGMLGDCQSATIIASTGAVEGVFESIVGSPGEGRRWSVEYEPNAVRVRNVCAADLTGDCAVNVFDFLAFQSGFGNGEPEGDFDGNGVLNVFDFLAFQSAAGSC